MKRTVLALILAAIAPAAWAANATCSAAWVNAGACRAATNLILFYDAPPAAFADLRDAIAAEAGYQTEKVCQAERGFDLLLNGQPSKIVSAAGVAEGDCTVEQIGTAVPNPQTAGAFADAVIEKDLREKIIRWRNRQAVEAADDPSQVATPDVGSGG